MEIFGYLEKGGITRVGVSVYNTTEEVDRLIDAIKTIYLVPDNFTTVPSLLCQCIILNLVMRRRSIRPRVDISIVHLLKIYAKSGLYNFGNVYCRGCGKRHLIRVC